MKAQEVSWGLWSWITVEERSGRLSSSKIAQAALTISSSDSSSWMRRRAAASGSASKLLTPRALTSVDQRLAAPAIEGLDGDSELVDKILDRLASEHAFTGFKSDLGGGVPWPIWLLLIRAKLSYWWSTFWGSGQSASSSEANIGLAQTPAGTQ